METQQQMHFVCVRLAPYRTDGLQDDDGEKAPTESTLSVAVSCDENTAAGDIAKKVLEENFSAELLLRVCNRNPNIANAARQQRSCRVNLCYGNDKQTVVKIFRAGASKEAAEEDMRSQGHVENIYLALCARSGSNVFPIGPREPVCKFAQMMHHTADDGTTTYTAFLSTDLGKWTGAKNVGTIEVWESPTTPGLADIVDFGTISASAADSEGTATSSEAGNEEGEASAVATESARKKTTKTTGKKKKAPDAPDKQGIPDSEKSVDGEDKAEDTKASAQSSQKKKKRKKSKETSGDEEGVASAAAAEPAKKKTKGTHKKAPDKQGSAEKSKSSSKTTEKSGDVDDAQLVREWNTLPSHLKAHFSGVSETEFESLAPGLKRMIMLEAMGEGKDSDKTAAAKTDSSKSKSSKASAEKESSKSKAAAKTDPSKSKSSKAATEKESSKSKAAAKTDSSKSKSSKAAAEKDSSTSKAAAKADSSKSKASKAAPKKDNAAKKDDSSEGSAKEDATKTPARRSRQSKEEEEKMEEPPPGFQFPDKVLKKFKDDMAEKKKWTIYLEYKRKNREAVARSNAKKKAVAAAAAEALKSSGNAPETSADAAAEEGENSADGKKSAKKRKKSDEDPSDKGIAKKASKKAKKTSGKEGKKKPTKK